MKLGHVFDPRNNALNAWRLVLAASVVLLHSWGVTGRVIWSRPVYQLMLCAGVDGFFAISGFLITASWLSNPRLREYLIARALRILPAFYVCLLVVAFVIAPIGVAMQGGSAAKLMLSGAPLEFVLRNSAVAMVQFDIGGTPQGVPVAGQWDTPLWTLMWEVLCYLAVAALGVVGLVSRRWIPAVIFALAWVGALLSPHIIVGGGLATQQNDLATSLLYIVARIAMMFSAGALIYQYRNVIPARWSLVALSVVIVMASSLLPDYRLVGALPLAYALITSASLVRNRRLQLRTDLSYGVYIYAFPIQQLLVIGGLAFLSPFLFFGVSMLATLPIAALSWFLIEKRALALKSRFRRRAAVGPEAAPQVPGVDHRTVN